MIAHPLMLSVGRAGAVRCGRDAPGRCAVAFHDETFTQFWIAALDGDTLEPPIEVSGFMFAITADGRRVAVDAGGHVDVIELASRHHEAWPNPPGLCGRSQFFAWSPRADAIYFTTMCDNGEGHLLRLERGRPASDVYTAPGWISGLSIGPDGVPLLGTRTYLPSAVILDGI